MVRADEHPAGSGDRERGPERARRTRRRFVGHDRGGRRRRDRARSACVTGARACPPPSGISIFDPFARGRLAERARGGKGLGLFIAQQDRRGARGVHRSPIRHDREWSSASSCRSRPGGGSDPRPDRRRPSALRRRHPRDRHRHGHVGPRRLRHRGERAGAARASIGRTWCSSISGFPDRSGLELGKEILEELPETKVVAVTALDDEKSVQDAFKAGFHGYLTKQTEASDSPTACGASRAARRCSRAEDRSGSRTDGR